MEYKNDSYWKNHLNELQYKILRLKETEPPFSGKYTNHFQEGTYHCAGCDAQLFSSSDKFDSHCGWPSFSKKIESNAIQYINDTSHGMIRTEVACTNCGGHLGHVFNDGLPPTNTRYCINSVSMIFKPTQNETDNT